MIVISSNLSAFPIQLEQRTFKYREDLPLRANVLWRIEQGAVRTLTWNHEGTLIVTGFWGAGDVVGQPLSSIKPYRIECLTKVEASILPSERWYPAFDAVLSHIQQAEEFLSILQSQQVRDRLLRLLVWLSQKFGCETERGRQIELRLTHLELAEVINTTRVTVTRLINELEREQAIARHQRYLILLGN
ncbi:Crp/Fnr family transcriptional regulator [Microseira wollei]|uniref:CRP/FNR family transcriptional regulator n=1 Tax=Microseira wollei NIES-4236 TaxID=2530354 RepID=A0AAV3XIS7_9CYAN|nr:Crp/Fnr family transcriptional regulator [Microseira wollei]GET41488.1 CRP/FNR family transcriptional regulator [Microseira wollei NIES-4236]